MKNTIKLFGIIVMAAIIGFSFAACDEEQTITLSGTPQVGSTITASTNRKQSTGDFSWEFSSLSGAYDWGGYYSYGNITGAHNQNCELVSGAGGRYIRAYLKNEKGDVLYSDVLGPIQQP